MIKWHNISWQILKYSGRVQKLGRAQGNGAWSFPWFMSSRQAADGNLAISDLNMGQYNVHTVQT